MGTEKNDMGKNIDQTRQRYRAFIYQKCLKNYQKVKIRRLPWTGEEKRLKFLISHEVTVDRRKKKRLKFLISHEVKSVCSRGIIPELYLVSHNTQNEM